LKLRISSDLSLPTEAVTQTFAILAMRGVGKTHTASVLAEEFCDARLPFAVLDPTGAWWGLRASADGKGEGYPVTILGGDHADAPLEETAGKVVADMVVEEPRPLVLDLSRLSKGAMRRFVADFAERLYEKNRDPLHLIIDEADAFAPQRPRPDEMRMLGAIDEIVRRGRIRGLGCTLVTQRSAVLNKDVLTQTEVLIILRTAHPRDRAPVLEWMKVHATPEQLRDVESSLAKLPKGDAWIMSAGWLDLFARTHIRARKTFNSSATPKPGERRIQPAAFAKIDPKILQERLSSAIERAKAEDPRELRRRIAVLEGELRKAKVVPAVVHPGPEEIARIRFSTVRELIERLDPQVDRLRDHAEGIGNILRFFSAFKVESKLAAASPLKHPGQFAEKSKLPERPIPLEKHRAPEGQRVFTSTSLGESGLKRMLIALAQRNGLTARQLGLRAGLSSKSGTFSTYLGRARSSGWINGSRERIEITEAGRAAIGSHDPLPEGRDLLEYWLGQLGNSGAARMLRVLADRYPRATAAEELGEAAELSASSGTFSTYLGRLRTLELVTGSKSDLRASEELFG
jgi:hypothetical protein